MVCVCVCVCALYSTALVFTPHLQSFLNSLLWVQIQTAQYYSSQPLYKADLEEALFC